MPRSRQALNTGWFHGFILSTLFLSGCTLFGFGSDQTHHSRTSESLSSRPSGVREIKVGISGGIVMKEVEVGRMPDGYLVKITWTDSLQLVRLLCVNPQAAGCQKSELVPPGNNHPSYRRQIIVLYVKEPMSDLTFQIMAHEICHAIANAQNLKPDPCHNENGGRI
jgi:hypothetical protein